MPDVFSKEKRSQVMGRIRGSGNKKTEVRLIEILRRNSITGWRRNWPLPGKPDLTFPTERVAIFVDGCFWHGCPTHMTWPKQNADFWEKKINRNKQRDREVNRELKSRGWTVLRIWEHSLKPTLEKRLIGRLNNALERGHT